jgi:succinoglycan biosynthesis protein ExoA
VRLLANPGRLQAAGMNLAAAAADPASDVLIRIDAHAAYPEDYVARLLAALGASGADSVVVRLRTVGKGCFQKAVAAASNGFLGTGGAEHRLGGVSRFVDHGHHAAFRRAAYVALGGYDPGFATNEDAEFDVRLRKRGGRIWFAADIVVDYVPRATARALARQYFRYGRGRAANVLKHRGPLRLRQLAPPALLLLLVAAAAVSPLNPLSLAVPGAYLSLLAVAAAGAALRRRDACVLGAAVAVPVMHLSWAAGFLIQLAVAAARPRPRRQVRAVEAEG